MGLQLGRSQTLFSRFEYDVVPSANKMWNWRAGAHLECVYEKADHVRAYPWQEKTSRGNLRDGDRCRPEGRFGGFAQLRCQQQ